MSLKKHPGGCSIMVSDLSDSSDWYPTIGATALGPGKAGGDREGLVYFG